MNVLKKIGTAILIVLFSLASSFAILVIASQSVKADTILVTSPIVGNPAIVNSKAGECMALNVYYEARSDNMAGKYAVADVVLNRVNDSRYPNTVCDVVKQGRLGNPPGSEVQRNMCQFSWFCDGKHDNPADEDSWQKAQIVAYNIMQHKKFRGITEGSTHYHATYVTPDWAETIEIVGTIGQHIFYRWE